MNARQITATVERTARGWTGETSTGKSAYITDGQAWWFSRDFANKLTREEDAALDHAAMRAIAEGAFKS
jgi:hypothetical protein